VQTHKRLGTRLEKAYCDRTSEIASVLALHFELGRDFASALRYLGQAAESSAKRLGHAEAASYLTRGLGILDRFDVADRFRLRIAVLRHRSLVYRGALGEQRSVYDGRQSDEEQAHCDQKPNTLARPAMKACHQNNRGRAAFIERK
jgi:hypothetical protein